MSDTQNAPTSNNETRLAEALHALRKVTSATTDDDKGRVVLYLDSIEVEMERINATRKGWLPGVDVCGKCRREFDDTDTRFDGLSRYKATPFCRGCVDRCHDNETADHRCPVCAETAR
jgi:hypothetical protein